MQKLNYKLMDSQQLNSLGWLPEVDLKDGLAQAYAAFLQDAQSGPSSPQLE